MPPKKRSRTDAKKKSRGKKAPPVVMLSPGMEGAGFFGDLWSGIKSVASKIKPSQVLGLIPHPAAQSAATVGRAVGLGRGKGRRGGAMPIRAPPGTGFRVQPYYA